MTADKRSRGQWPHANEVYTTSQIFNSLTLPDSPHLTVVWNGKDHPVQTAHMGPEAIRRWCDAGAGDYRWRFLRVTREEIPIFIYVDSRLPIRILDAERWIYRDGEVDKHDGALWLTPTGFPRKQ